LVTISPFQVLPVIFAEHSRLAEAGTLLEGALHIQDQQLRALTLNDLALVYIDEGLYEDAEPLLKRALQIQEIAFGPLHLTVAVGLNSLAVLFVSDRERIDLVQ
jgi:hypothetical protein